MDKKKKFYLNLETLRDIFQICPRVRSQDFDELPTDEDIVSFFKELGHTGEIKSITDVVVDQMHQPWRTFATIINRSLSGKTTGLDKLRLSREQILWANEVTQIYGARIPESMTSPEMRETKTYKNYLGYATGVTPPKKAIKLKLLLNSQLFQSHLKNPQRSQRELRDLSRNLLIPHGKMIVDSIENGPYVWRMISTPEEQDLPVPVPESLHEQTDEELTETDIKRIYADDQAIQTILLGLLEDVYDAVDSYEMAKEI
nr:hypothetical protein [Tanacetum cinerariifolium]